MARTLSMLVVVLCFAGLSACAADNGDTRSLRDLLAAETDRHVDRAAELAVVRDRGLDRAWWQSGFVAGDDRWLSYDEAVAATKQSGIRQLYEAERSAAGDSPEDQLRLASWCGKNGLLDRERAHLLAALTMDPRLQTERLLKHAGFERVLGGWMSKEQRKRIEVEADRIDESLERWRTRLLKIERQLRGPGSIQRIARNRLKEISDPQAVAAIDLVLGRSPHLETVRAAMQTLSQIDSYEASQVLAKYAAFSDDATVRREATEHLSGRRYEDFIPQLVSLLATEMRATCTVNRIRSSNWFGMLFPEMAVQLKLERVTDKQVQIVYGHLRLVPRIVSVEVTRDPVFEVSLAKSARQISARLDAKIHVTKRRIDEVNELTVEVNRRISKVLSSLSGHPPTADPHFWWQWWDQQLDVDAPPRTVVEVSEDETVVEVPLHHRRHSCFAAGTPVWTENGLRSIESITVGDRVLSKDVESGELAFRPVLRTTIREAKPLVVVRSVGDEFKVTGGHRFWQSGHGWIIARDLASLSRVHSVTGNVFIDGVHPGPTEPTYNLVVEDSHTYFVGNAGLLVQDLLLTSPTNMVVPGLTRFELQNRATAKLK